MSKFVAILEDDAERLAQMRICLGQLLPQYECVCFDDSSKMIGWLKEHLPEVVLISLDHDLPMEPDHGNGRDVADWLSTYSPVCPAIVHTSNEFFAPAMMQVLADCGWHVERVYPHSDHHWVAVGWSQQIREFMQTGWIFG